MTELINLTKAQELPKVFEVYFYKSYQGLNVGDLILAKSFVDYQRMFGFDTPIVHVSVRLGEFVWEMSKEGGVDKYAWQEELLDDPRLMGFYTLDISKFEEHRRWAAVFCLNEMLGQKLDVFGCLKYLWQSIGLYKNDYQLGHSMSVATQDFNLDKGTYFINKRKESFNLPYTCATLVNIVLHKLLDYEPNYISHLAAGAQMTLTVYAELGIGSIYDLYLEEYFIDNG